MRMRSSSRRRRRRRSAQIQDTPTSQKSYNVALISSGMEVADGEGGRQGGRDGAAH